MGTFRCHIFAGFAVVSPYRTAMNERSALTSICTGDQGIFVHRSLLERIGGIPNQPLMEDIELSKRLRRISKPIRIRKFTWHVLTSLGE
ncbi:MAG: hypothetical protein Ct9H300mP8_06260 [Gammaproteobacteria bacterium]|nr:MAG: hypothetical protein Ct9H300mP8_06260 [Gammaproteobacteria bacterium]